MAAPSPCRVTAQPTVLARRVSVRGGVEVRASGAGFDVRFATVKGRCVSLEWPSPIGDLQPRPCSPPPSTWAEADARYDPTPPSLDLPGRPAPALLGTVVQDSPPWLAGPEISLAGRQPPTIEGDARPRLVPAGGDLFLLLRVDGGLETGNLRAQPVSHDGAPRGPAIDLSSGEVSVIGRPSAALAPHGAGLVVYLASKGDELDVFGTPISCSAP